jgi:hypothetical protein
MMQHLTADATANGGRTPPQPAQAGQLLADNTPRGAAHRVPRPSRPKRIEHSMVRFTADEFALIRERARECGRPPARYIRETALGAVPRSRRSAANAAVIRELARIGNALTQLAEVARRSDSPADSAAIEAALGEVLETIRRID